MSLTADRIRLINSVHGANITIAVMDLSDGQGHASGTRIVILLPRLDTPAHGA